LTRIGEQNLMVRAPRTLPTGKRGACVLLALLMGVLWANAAYGFLRGLRVLRGVSLLTRIGGQSLIRRAPFTMLTGKRGAGVSLVLLMGVLWANAAWSVTVRAELERQQIQLGDSVGVEIVVSDFPGGTISPRFPQVDGLSVQRTGSGMRLVNGRRSDVLNCTLTPTREGRFVIPPISVEVDGKIYETNGFVLIVSKIPQSAEMRLVASVSKRECYVLEPVDVTLDWYISADVREPEVNVPLLAQKDELSLKAIPPAPSADKLRIVANRYELIAARSYRELDGMGFTVVSLAFRIFPPQPGVLALGRATARAEVQTGTKLVQDDFFLVTRRVPDYKQVFAASDAIELRVKDLPTEGRPAGFTGAAGKFQISLETADTRVKVGDPILVKIAVAGDGLLEKIKRPLLSQDAQFSSHFAINESLAPGDISGERIVFEQTLRAKSEDVKAIPSLEFPYFDPEKGAYQVAQSKPIPIAVLPTTEVTAEDVIRFGQESSAAGTTPLEEQPGGILANHTHLDTLQDQSINWSLFSFVGVPPVAYFVALVVVSRRRKLAGDVALARAKSARRALKKHLSEARIHLHTDDRQFCDSLARAVSRFASDTLNLGSGELTAYDVERLAEENRLDRSAAERMAEILRECDAARFAPLAQSVEHRRKLLQKAEQVIGELQKGL